MNAPPGIWAKAVDKVTNINPGPPAGSKPLAKTIGNIASPASNATKVSPRAMMIADRYKLTLAGRYAEYVRTPPAPTFTEKKACPTAARTIAGAILLKSARKRKSTVREKSPTIALLITSAIKVKNNAGITIFTTFSRPVFTPRDTTKTVPAMNTMCQKAISKGLCRNVPKPPATSAAGIPTIEPLAVLMR